MTGSTEWPWAVLAFDHRERAFSSVRPAGMTHAQIRDAKQLIYEAFAAAVDGGLGRARAGVLVDEEFGADIARQASADGTLFAMPVERAGQRVFSFEYGDDFGEHLLKFRPASAKALVNYCSTDAAETRQTQLSRLVTLSDFLAGQDIDFVLELIVRQNHAEDGSASVDVEDLCRSMAQMQEAGVRADLWKVEGTNSGADAERVAAQALAADANASCIVLSAGAPTEVVGRWLDVAAVTGGFNGFAIGRSIWGAHVAAWLDGVLTRQETIERIASVYRSCTQRYLGAMVA